MIREIAALAEAMGVPFERDMVEVNLKILSSLAPEATTSMQRDVMEGKDSRLMAWSTKSSVWERDIMCPCPCMRK